MGNKYELSGLKDTNVLVLPDGRRMAYAEYGDPHGKPVILFHGNHNSRLMYGGVPDFKAKTAMHLVVPDRPGYGLSDSYRNGLSVVDYPEDVTILAESLGFGKFAVFGFSGGGPAALACAWKIPGFLTAAGVFGTIGPLTASSGKGIIPALRVLYWLAPRVPWSIRLPMAIVSFLVHNYLDLYLNLRNSKLIATDQEIIKRLGLGESLRLDRIEGFRQGGRASANDIALAGRWPIPLEQIRMKVHLWQGTGDGTVGGMGKHVSQLIPDCDANFIHGAGHYWLFENFNEILTTLITSNIDEF